MFDQTESAYHNGGIVQASAQIVKQQNQKVLDNCFIEYFLFQQNVFADCQQFDFRKQLHFLNLHHQKFDEQIIETLNHEYVFQIRRLVSLTHPFCPKCC